MKTEVYSWRISTGLKTELEQEARRRKLPVSAVLEFAAREWLTNSGTEKDSEEQQRTLRNAATACFGTIAGGNPGRSENARQTLRQRLRRQHGR